MNSNKNMFYLLKKGYTRVLQLETAQAELGLFYIKIVIFVFV